MSRSNPFKKKRYKAKKTLLFYGEGLREEIFLKHLRALFSQNKNISITIKRGKGGTADGLVIYTSRLLGSFDARITVLDNDKSKSEMKQARDEAKKKGIILLEHTPCIESLFLSILYGGRSFKNKDSKWCKQKFEDENPRFKRSSGLKDFENLFTKRLLNKRRDKVIGLKNLIELMEGRGC